MSIELDRTIDGADKEQDGVLGSVRSWLLERGVPEEQAELAVGNIVGFYRPYILGLFQRILKVGVTGAEAKNGSPDIRLHFCWPPDLISTSANLRPEYQAALLRIFSREVTRPSRPYLSLRLEFREINSPVEDAEGFFKDIAQQTNRQYFGFLDESLFAAEEARVSELIRKESGGV